MVGKRSVEPEQETTKKIAHDVVTEQVMLAAACVDREARARLIRLLPADAMVSKKHSLLWAGLRRIEQQGLDVDEASLMQSTGDPEVVRYAQQLIQARPTSPTAAQLDHHATQHRWDVARVRALRGPVNAFIEIAKDPSADPSRVRSLAKQIAASLEGYEHRKWLFDPDDLVRSCGASMDERSGGHAIYPYGIPDLDRYEQGYMVNKRGTLVDMSGRARFIPGAKPGQMTVLTGVSGGGKSTLAAKIAVAQADMGRRVLYGAWEPQAPDMLELMALLSLGYSRSEAIEGLLTKDQKEALHEEESRLSKFIRFMGNPVLTQENGIHEQKPSNTGNLEVIAGYIADTGAEVFIADLWERCLTIDNEERDTRNALFMQQRIGQRLGVHQILLAQQRLKDIESRMDKRPTREGIKGTSAWVDVADTIIGVHDPSKFKDVDENVLEVLVLKQRWGKWPQLVEFEWDEESGHIGAGRTVPLDRRDVGSEGNAFDAALKDEAPKGKRAKK